jgi:hypothetical protein
MQTQATLNGSDRIFLVLALNRAQISRFTKSDWSGFSDAIGDAHMVKFWPEDHTHLRHKLGISHWHPDTEYIILDESGLTWTAISPVNGYCDQVHVGLNVEISEVSTPEDYWYVREGEISAIDAAIAKLTPDQRFIVLACPEEAKPFVLQGLGVSIPEEPPEPEPVTPIKAWLDFSGGEYRAWRANADGCAVQADRKFNTFSTACQWLISVVPDLSVREIAHRCPKASEVAAPRLQAVFPPRPGSGPYGSKYEWSPD